MKKILFIILTAVLIFAVSASAAFAAEEPADAAPEISEESEEAICDGFFGELYNEVAENADKILAALTFIGSLIIAFAYKRGLIPLLNGALSNMNSMITKLKEETENSVIENESVGEIIKERLAASEEVIATLTSSIEALEEKLKSVSETKRDSEKAKIIMNAQIDMLYEIFMSSALPQYSKDRVGERVAEMKAHLTESEE